jgi:tocopherol O-methyltransferase
MIRESDVLAERKKEYGVAHHQCLESIVQYYDHTRFDYWAVWHNQDNYAFHFGYYSPHVREHHHALTNSNKVLADIARVQPGDRVLDAGCGLGGSSFWLATHRRAEVVGITPVPHQITKARKIARSRSLDSLVQFYLADYTRMPVSSEFFDVVWALESLCHAPDKSAFYREAARVLRPGGRLIVAEYIRAARDLDRETEVLMSEWFDGWSIPDLDTRDEHLMAIAGAGFSDIRFSDNTTAIGPSGRRLYKLARALGPANRMLHCLGLRTDAQHGNVLASLRQYQLLRSGAWFYGIISAVKR